MDAHKHAQFLGNLDKQIVSVLFLQAGKNKPTEFYEEHFGEVLSHLMNKLHKDADASAWINSADFPEPPVEIPARGSGSGEPVRGSGKPEMHAIQPKVIQYSAAGVPVTEQEVATAKEAPAVESIDWAPWTKGAIQTEKLRKGNAKAMVQSIINQLYRTTFESDVPIRMERQKSTIRCIATEAMEIGTLKLPAVVFNPSNLMDTPSKNFLAVTVEYKELGQEDALECKFSLSPEFNLPKTPEVADQSLDWKLSHSALVFWGIAVPSCSQLAHS
jgi:hypothetical protein